MTKKNNELVSDEAFTQAVKENFAVSSTLRSLGLCIGGGSYKCFALRVKRLGIDTSHFTGQAHNKGKTYAGTRKLLLNELLIKDSDRVFTPSFKRRLINEGLLKEECQICKIGPHWNGNRLVLQTDHINGDSFDHRIENLRLLCPNCHSQTDTFTSKSNNKAKNGLKSRYKGDVPTPIKELVKYYCKFCNEEIKSKHYVSCKSCYNTHRKELQNPYDRTKKIEWPPIEEVLERVRKSSYSAVAKELGVSDNAIRKHIKHCGEEVPRKQANRKRTYTDV